MLAYGSLLFLCLFGSNSAASCNNGWVLNGQSCYHISRDASSWVEAMKMCELHGGTLAKIETSGEQLFLAGLVSGNKHTHAYWLGATDWGKEAEWVWEPEGVMMDFTNWHKGSPDNNGNVEHCLILDSSSNNRWDDRNCHSTHYYICETMASGLAKR